MVGKRAITFWVLFLALSVAMPGWGAQGVGKALDEAMKSRGTGTVEEVSQQYQKAAEQTDNPGQRANVWSLLADYLMENHEWEKAIEVFDRILTEGTVADRPGAYYGAAQAYLMLNQPEKARAICAELKANHPNSTIEEFANFMKGISPGSDHAKLADYLAESPAGVTEAPEKTAGLVEAPPPEETKREMPAPQPEGKKEADIEEKPEIEENSLAVGVRGWNSDLLGHIDAKGMTLDLSNGTDIGRQSKIGVCGSWKFSGKDQLRLDYSQFDHNGNLTQGVNFDNLAYSPGASLKVRTSFFDAGLSRLLDESEHGSWKLLYGVKFSKMFIRVAQQVTGGTRAGELNTDFAVPYLGIEGNAKLSGNVTLNGALKYFALNRSGASGRVTDLDVALLIGRDYTEEPAETEWYGTLGYRFFLLHGTADNDSAEIRYAGPTVGLTTRF